MNPRTNKMARPLSDEQKLYLLELIKNNSNVVFVDFKRKANSLGSN